MEHLDIWNLLGVLVAFLLLDHLLEELKKRGK